MFKKIKSSAKNLTTSRGLVLTAMLLSLYSVLGMFKIPVAPDNRITLTFAASSAAGMILGPLPAMIAAGLGDILGYVLNPGGGAYFYGFTLSAAAGGFIYGICLYKRPKKYAMLWVILAVFLTTFLINIMLNTFWLSIMYEKAYEIFALTRIVKNLIVLPLHIAIIFALFTLKDKINIQNKYF